MDTRPTPPAANQTPPRDAEREAGAVAPPFVERRAPRPIRDDDPAGGTERRGVAATDTPSAQTRRRKDDDPNSPLPARAAVQPTGFGAHAVGHAMRYLRRATDALPPEAPPPSIDVVTPALRKRLLDADAETTKPRLLTAGAWRWPLFIVVGIGALLALSWLTAGW